MKRFSQTGRKYKAILIFVVVLLQIAVTSLAWAMSTEDEIKMGREVAKEVEKEVPLVQDAALQNRVQTIGLKLAAVSDRPNLPYTFKVLDSKEVNAFAVPGGFIYVYKGLIDLMPSDDELAGVIGHEIGHIVKRHSIKESERGTGLSLLMLILLQGRGLPLQATVMDALMAGYSRDDEREADYLGFVHSTKAGYSPYGMLMGLEKLAAIEPKDSADLFSDHPESAERIRLMQQYIAAAKIHPFVKADGSNGIVYEKNWQLPPFTNSLNGSTPLYRAYSAAGQIYQLTKEKNLSADELFASSEADGIGIYYNDRLLFTVTARDAADAGLSPDDLAGRMINSIKEWISLEQSSAG